MCRKWDEQAIPTLDTSQANKETWEQLSPEFLRILGGGLTNSVHMTIIPKRRPKHKQIKFLAVMIHVQLFAKILCFNYQKKRSGFVCVTIASTASFAFTKLETASLAMCFGLDTEQIYVLLSVFEFSGEIGGGKEEETLPQPGMNVPECTLFFPLQTNHFYSHNILKRYLSLRLQRLLLENCMNTHSVTITSQVWKLMDWWQCLGFAKNGNRALIHHKIKMKITGKL